MSDSIAAPVTATLNITVLNTNDAPVANADSVTTNEDVAVAITLSATDPDVGDTLTYAVVGAPSNGVLSGTAPNLTYTPNAGYLGADSFTFKANDGTVDSNIATISITVVDFITPIGVTSVTEYTGGNGAPVIRLIDGSGLSANSPSGTHDNHEIAESMYMSNGAIAGNVANEEIVFDLGSDYDLNTAYVWQMNQGHAVNAGGARNTRTMNILVSSDNVNFTQIGGTVTLATADGSNSALPAEVIALAANNVRYVKFDLLTAGSGNATEYCGLSEVRFGGNRVNNAPTFTANPIAGSDATQDTAYAGSIAGSATDDDGDSLIYAKVSGPAWLSVAADGTLSGTPASGDVGANAFVVSADDSNGGTDTATLNITVVPPPSSTKLVRTTVSGVTNTGWTTVSTGQTYSSPVIVATPIHPTGVTTPVVTRISNITGTSFDLKLERADGLTGALSYDVSVIVVEEGVYTQAVDGVTMEAVKFTSTITAHKGNWVAEARSFQNSYTNPVVVGQVMSANDGNWSTFWSMGGQFKNPVDATNLNVGKHVGEDTNTARANETIGYIVIESGIGNIDGVAYEAALGGDTIQGFDNSATPFNYSLSGSLSAANAVVLSQTAMDGNDGSWAVLYGSTPFSTTNIDLYVAEDQIGDSEQSHGTEQVGYIVFE